jgi:hypothetical protein
VHLASRALNTHSKRRSATCNELCRQRLLKTLGGCAKESEKGISTRDTAVAIAIVTTSAIAVASAIATAIAIATTGAIAAAR